jgi:hypothetical protein
MKARFSSYLLVITSVRCTQLGSTMQLYVILSEHVIIPPPTVFSSPSLLNSALLCWEHVCPQDIKFSCCHCVTWAPELPHVQCSSPRVTAALCYLAKRPGTGSTQGSVRDKPQRARFRGVAYFETYKNSFNYQIRSFNVFNFCLDRPLKRDFKDFNTHFYPGHTLIILLFLFYFYLCFYLYFFIIIIFISLTGNFVLCRFTILTKQIRWKQCLSFIYNCDYTWRWPPWGAETCCVSWCSKEWTQNITLCTVVLFYYVNTRATGC